MNVANDIDGNKKSILQLGLSMHPVWRIHKECCNALLVQENWLCHQVVLFEKYTYCYECCWCIKKMKYCTLFEEHTENGIGVCWYRKVHFEIKFCILFEEWYKKCFNKRCWYRKVDIAIKFCTLFEKYTTNVAVGVAGVPKSQPCHQFLHSV